MRCLSVGNVACDIILKPRRMELIQERLILDDVSLSAGGDALNVAVDLSIMGDEAALIGCVGTDDFGHKIMRSLEETGVNTKYMIQSGQMATVTSVLMLNPNGERRAAYKPGGNELLREAHIPEEAIEWAEHVHLGSPMRLTSMDGKGTANLFRRAKQKGKTTSMDLVLPLDDVWLPKIEEVLNYCDIFLPSDYEVSHVCGLSNPLEMKDFFRAYGVSVFGVKMGTRGVFVTDYKEDVWFPAVVKEGVKNTLGAGDAFVAAFISAYKRELPLRMCVAVASMASGHIVREMGTTNGMVKFEELYSEAKKYLEESI